jgi:DNA-binding response OmpR family regulator
MNNKAAAGGKSEILLVDDDCEVLKTMEEVLSLDGYRPLTAKDAREARAILSRERPDLIVLDIMLPDGNGLDLCREIREKSDAPILFLSGLSGKNDIRAGLRDGDDYLTKPFDFDILEARIDALLRRAARVPKTVTKGPMELNVIAGLALLGGADMLLTQKEFALLLLFAQNEGRVFSAENLYEKVWGLPIGDDNRTLKKHLSNLRKKLKEENSGYEITAARGEGYCFMKTQR